MNDVLTKGGRDSYPMDVRYTDVEKLDFQELETLDLKDLNEAKKYMRREAHYANAKVVVAYIRARFGLWHSGGNRNIDVTLEKNLAKLKEKQLIREEVSVAEAKQLINRAQKLRDNAQDRAAFLRRKLSASDLQKLERLIASKKSPLDLAAPSSS